MSGRQIPQEPYIFVTPSDVEGFDNVIRLICEAASKIEIPVFRPDRYMTYDLAFYDTDPIISHALFIVSEVDMLDLGQMSVLGYARGIRKPVIYIASDIKYVTAEFRSLDIILYDLNNPKQFVDAFIKRANLIRKSPDHYLSSTEYPPQRVKPKIFISYSHCDCLYLERLMVHLKPLERDRLIDLWVDKRIHVGDRWKKEIDIALSDSSIAILLISADYLASDFVVNDELPMLLKNAEKRGTKIVPLILKPCRFARDSSLREFQAINDPKDPIISMTEGEREKYFDLVAQEVERNTRSWSLPINSKT